MEHRFTHSKLRLPQYVTLRIMDGYPLFMDTTVRSMLIDGIRALHSEGVEIFAFVIMPNHIHLVAQHQQIERLISNFQHEIATKILLYLMSTNRSRIIQHMNELAGTTVAITPADIWQSPPQWTPIHDANQLEKYIWLTHQNPVKAGIVRNPESWRWSSYLLTSDHLEPLNLSEAVIPVRD